jgi:hypothetical protein
MQDDRVDDQESTSAATEPRPEPEAAEPEDSALEVIRREKDALQDRLLRPPMHSRPCCLSSMIWSAR